MLKEQKGVQISIPYSGPEAEGFVKFQVGDAQAESPVTKNIPIVWKKGGLFIEDETFDLSGIKFNVDALLLIKHPAKLFVVQVKVLDQPFSLNSPIPNFDISIDAQHLRSEFKMNGSLSNPQSWLAQGKVFAEKIRVRENQKAQSKLEFDHTGAAFRFIGGKLIIERAEASSHELVILMNGVVQNNLFSYGTVRFIGTSVVANKLNRIYHGSRAIHLDHMRSVVLEPLDNPDRQFCDIRFDGKLTNLQVKHNRSDHWESFNEVIDALKEFKDKELEEDGLLKPR